MLPRSCACSRCTFPCTFADLCMSGSTRCLRRRPLAASLAPCGPKPWGMRSWHGTRAQLPTCTGLRSLRCTGKRSRSARASNVPSVATVSVVVSSIFLDVLRAPHARCAVCCMCDMHRVFPGARGPRPEGPLGSYSGSYRGPLSSGGLRLKALLGSHRGPSRGPSRAPANQPWQVQLGLPAHHLGHLGAKRPGIREAQAQKSPYVLFCFVLYT